MASPLPDLTNTVPEPPNPNPVAVFPEAVALPKPVLTEPAAWSLTPFSRIPLAPSFAASSFSLVITAFVFP